MAKTRAYKKIHDKVLGALVAVVVITAAGLTVHHRVERLIDVLEDL